MNSTVKHGLLGTAFTAMTTVLLSGSAAAQFPVPDSNPPAAAVEELATATAQAQLVDVIPSSSGARVSRPTAAELRQARAQYRSQQRIERMERNLWAGYEPLRPNWNAIPMMSSRYRYPTTIYVPVYYYPR
jgi:hypothetical protein